MVRVLSMLTLCWVLTAFSPPCFSKRRPAYVSRTSAHFKLEKATEYVRLRDRRKERRYNKEMIAEFTRLLAKLEPRLKSAMSKLAKRHRKMFKFGRYSPKNIKAKEGDKNRIEYFDLRGKRLPIKRARGPFNYEAELPKYIWIKITFKKVPSPRWRKLLVTTLSKIVDPSHEPDP